MLANLTLQFTLPEEEESLNDALNGAKYKTVLQGIDRKLRDRLKYEWKDEIQTQEVRNLIFAELGEQGLKLYE